jgi:uncharacterized protein (TIGR00375 family)
MPQVLDLHIHSKYSRACSPQLTLENIAITCVTKGVDIISTADFTHPLWFKEIENKLEEINNSGLYQLKDSNCVTKFILGTEVSLVYKDKDKTRRLHLVIHAPSIEKVRALNNKLSERFNLRSDGRPILGISAAKFCQICFAISPDFIIYPAHIWTPWYAIFGSKSGYDSFEDCFEEYTKYIYAFETGLSSDPDMNSLVSALDNLTLLSSSDAHSLDNIGREATIMDFVGEPTYQKILDNIKNHKIVSTIEFYPEEGMYHFDGHANCHFSCTPQESKKLKGLCPKCGKPLIIGVSSRVTELLDRKNIQSLHPFIKTIELDKIIAQVLGVKSRKSVKVKKEYNRLIGEFGSELDILLHVDLKKITPVNLSYAIACVRQGKLTISPGYDGVYGEIKIKC